MGTTRDLTTWHLASMADCLSPDAWDGIGGVNANPADYKPSPGAVFLRNVAVACDEWVDEMRDNPDAQWPNVDWGDWGFHEMVDGCVPICTHEAWATFVDLGAYHEDLMDYGEIDTRNLTCSVAMVALSAIGERLAAVLFQRATEGDQ